jgi:hypothetical protein
MARNRIWLDVGLTAVLVCCAASAGADSPRLKIYGDRPSPHGLWKMELLESSDEQLMANAKRLSEAAVCMDAALEMGKNVKPQESPCTQSVVTDTSAEAQIEKNCPGGTTVMKMKRESKDTIAFETVERGKAGIISTMKGRYHYVGPCSATDNLMKADKDSEVCQRMRAEAAMDPEATCGQLESAEKTDCLGRIQAALERSRKLCE